MAMAASEIENLIKALIRFSISLAAIAMIAAPFNSAWLNVV